jgi:3D (Asp-Asp-Asp) domain-containing protein
MTELIVVLLKEGQLARTPKGDNIAKFWVGSADWKWVFPGSTIAQAWSFLGHYPKKFLMSMNKPWKYLRNQWFKKRELFIPKWTALAAAHTIKQIRKEKQQLAYQRAKFYLEKQKVLKFILDSTRNGIEGTQMDDIEKYMTHRAFKLGPLMAIDPTVPLPEQIRQGLNNKRGHNISGNQVIYNSEHLIVKPTKITTSTQTSPHVAHVKTQTKRQKVTVQQEVSVVPGKTKSWIPFSGCALIEDIQESPYIFASLLMLLLSLFLLSHIWPTESCQDVTGKWQQCYITDVGRAATRMRLRYLD